MSLHSSCFEWQRSQGTEDMFTPQALILLARRFRLAFWFQEGMVADLSVGISLYLCNFLLSFNKLRR